MDSPLHDRPLLLEACPDERSDFGKEWGEVEKQAFPSPEKHWQEVSIAVSLRSGTGGQLQIGTDTSVGLQIPSSPADDLTIIRLGVSESRPNLIFLKKIVILQLRID